MKILLIGHSGRVGSLIKKIVSENVKYEVIYELDLNEQNWRSNELGKIIEPEKTVIIDFSSETGLSLGLDIAKELNLPMVSGTTGISESVIDKLIAASKEIPLVYDTNMSVGMNLTRYIARQVSKFIPKWDTEIMEIHHNKKVDAPSGSALSLSEAIQDGRKMSGIESQWKYHQPERKVEEKIETGHILSLRGGTVVGDHTAFWFGDHERIELSHRAENREIFAQGALHAAYWLLDRQKKSGLFNMDNVIGID